MTLSTNGINIDNLPIEKKKIKPMGLKYYQDEIQKTIDKIKEDGKKGIAIFRDNQKTNTFSKPSLKIDF